MSDRNRIMNNTASREVFFTSFFGVFYFFMYPNRSRESAETVS